MSLRIAIELAGPPRGKGAGRAAISKDGHARVFTDDRTRKYESQLRYAAQQQMAGRPPTAQPVLVVIEARLPIPTTWSKRKHLAALAGQVWPLVKPDCNNFSKCLDSLNGVVWVDDKQIVDERVRKVYSESPGLTVIIETVEPPAAPPLSPKMAAAPEPDLWPQPPSAEVEVAIARSRCRGRVDVAYEHAVEHLRHAASRGLTAPELCAALGEPKPGASWERALWLVADYASAVMRAAREMPAVSR